MKTSYDVLVSGAGPVGLWLACELKLAQIDVAVLDRRPARTTESRALAIHGRTLEMFGLRGCAEDFLEAGRKIPLMEYGALDTRLAFSSFESRFPFTLFLRQTKTEEFLEKRALALGIPLLRETEVTQVEQNEAEVHVTTSRGPFSAPWLVGADGARSLVRHQAGIGFDGFDGRVTAMLGDVVLAKPPEEGGVLSMVTSRGALMMSPLGDGVHHRVIAIDAERSSVEKDTPLTVAELASAALKISGKDYGMGEASWLSRFTDATRLASAYRKGRILLAGDAAHIHAPMGGQGLNVGLQDAMNLGWKLAMVVRKQAPDNLLDTYHSERRPVGQMLFDNTLAQVALATSFTPPNLSLRNTMNDILSFSDVNNRLASEISGFGIAYGYDKVVPETLPAHLVSGKRVPDVDLVVENQPATLYGCMEKGEWVHLAFSPEEQDVPECPEWLDPNIIKHITAYRVDDSPAFSGVSSVLIRPDGYAHSVAMA
ncbi:FAD-dependent monooxygenase [Komagataeibacter xylinus]|uniref:2-polyprenyl-6-methoxyphenol hydroxylase n=1 Tax=Komagataeibacter xylinus TaxID=28448 RepID=A0A857FUC2_KOMXY|nr:FAD-dependent monooxygenase [Komagataeibacter xylinus]QHC36797.1 2-polyprenyl-6-methoxyphenol hydroxylase [Komagataeibacter xylinus]